MCTIFKKASFIACLFCFYQPEVLYAQALRFESSVEVAYRHTLNFEFSKSSELLANSSSAESKYVQSLNEAVQLLLTEDHDLFSKFESNFENRLPENLSSDVERFVAAEMNLHWAFVYLKFGHELDAASHFRKAYKIAIDCRKNSPSFIPIRKTTGLLEIMVGAVPEKYNWIMDLFGIKGSINNGLKDLQQVATSDMVLAYEASLLKGLIEGYIMEPRPAASQLVKLIETRPTAAARFASASLYVKGGASETAFQILEDLNTRSCTPLEYYLLAEILLHRGDYAQSIKIYNRFLEVYKGHNNIKDAYYKIGVCFRLMGNQVKADSTFAVARVKGNETVEADKSAARTMSAVEKSDTELLRARYFIDGGYFDKARTVLNAIPEQALRSQKDRVEYFYRKARLEHGSGHIAAAKLFYQQVIDMSENQPWYFAPNSCLQMGYLLLQQQREVEAKTFFRKALSYKHHEYKNSIDSKAKTALNRLKR